MLSKIKLIWAKQAKVLSALVIRGGVMGLQFLTNLVLVFVVGPVGAGVYALYHAWLIVFSRLSGLGSTTHSLRTVAVLSGRSDPKGVAEYLKRIVRLVAQFSLLLGLIYVILRDYLARELLGDASFTYIVVAAAAGGTLTTVLKIFAESLKAMGRVNTSLFLEWALLPTAIIITVLSAYMTLGTIEMALLLQLHILFLLCVVFSMVWVIRRQLRAMDDQQKISAPADLRLKTLSPFWGGELSVVWFINIPLLLMPQFVSTAQIGIFSVALKLILIVTSVLVVLSSIYGPKFAQKYDRDDIAGVLADLRQTQLFSVILYLPLFLLFMLAPQWTMGIFGEEFREGAKLLQIMAMGQLGFALFGLGDFVLNMIGKERTYFWINLASTALMLMLCLTLMPIYDAQGAALAVAIATGFKQGSAYILVQHYLRNDLKNRSQSAELGV